jgi:hypothetical protein
MTICACDFYRFPNGYIGGFVLERADNPQCLEHHPKETPMPETIDDIQLLIAQKAILDEGAAIIKETRRRVAADMKPSERRAGGDWGFASLSAPKDVVEIDDREQLHLFLAAEGKERVSERITDVHAALDVLRIHAPHLIAETTEIPGWAETEAISRAKAGESIPGVLIKPGVPTLSLRLTDAGKAFGRQVMAGAMPQVEAKA